MLLLYNLFLEIYLLAARFLSIWNPKARLWLHGRNNIFTRLADTVGSHRGNIVWIHCASLGEFEQGRPVLESIRKKYPQYKILLSFFSPSGFEVRKNYPHADFIFYLPLDGPGRSVRFVDTVGPVLAIFIKYEYWYHYLKVLNERKIPSLLVSAIFRPGQPFFAWYGGLWRKMLRSYEHLFVQHENSAQLLRAIGIVKKVSISGDTRFDRVIEIAEKFERIPLIESFCGNFPVLVAGSTWEEDEEELVHYTRSNPEKRFILVPHEIDDERLNEVSKLFPESIRFSKLKNGETAQPTNNVLVIDNIGMLSKLYKYAHITYVGGGFGGDGIHNILEATVYGKPVIFGPEYEKFREAVDLVELGAAISIENAVELEELLNRLFTRPDELMAAGEIAKNYVYRKAGATQKILDYIQENRLLTN